MNTKTTAAETVARILPIGWPETRKLFRERFDSHDYWIAIFDPGSLQLLIKIEEKFFSGPANADLDVCIVDHEGQAFVAAAMRKSSMPNWKFQSLLRQVGIRLTEPEMVERDCLVIVRQHRMPDAVAMVEKLLGNRDLALTA